MTMAKVDWINGFLPTPSARRATSMFTPSCQQLANFYPRPPRGGRPEMRNLASLNCVISTHALREEGDSCDELSRFHNLTISTHALREEGDTE